MKKTLLIFIAFALILSGCSVSSSGKSASWAYQFVNYGGSTYIVTCETAGAAGKELGTIKYFSTDETGDSRKDLFSNCYGKGTALYSIKGLSENEAIAVKESDSKYIKLVNKNSAQSSK